MTSLGRREFVRPKRKYLLTPLLKFPGSSKSIKLCKNITSGSRIIASNTYVEAAVTAPIRMKLGLVIRGRKRSAHDANGARQNTLIPKPHIAIAPTPGTRSTFTCRTYIRLCAWIGTMAVLLALGLAPPRRPDPVPTGSAKLKACSMKDSMSGLHCSAPSVGGGEGVSDYCIRCAENDAHLDPKDLLVSRAFLDPSGHPVTAPQIATWVLG